MRRALLVLTSMLWMPATGPALTYYVIIRLRDSGSPPVRSPRPKAELARDRPARRARRAGPFLRPAATG